MSIRTLGIGALIPAGIAFGALSLAIARREPASSFAGELSTRAAAELIAGWSLLAVGLVAWTRRRGSSFGPLLVAASFGWFLLEWNNPGIGSALGFALGLALYAVAPPLVAHAALVYSGRRLSAPLERIVLAAAYAGAILHTRARAGARVRPRERGVHTMPEQPPADRAIASPLRRVEPDRRPGRTRLVARAHRRAGTQARSSESGAPPTALAGAASGAAYLGLVAWTFAAASSRGKLGNSPIARDLWLGQAAALVALASGVVWGWLRARHTRAADRAPRRRGRRVAGTRRPS